MEVSSTAASYAASHVACATAGTVTEFNFSGPLPPSNSAPHPIVVSSVVSTAPSSLGSPTVRSSKSMVTGVTVDGVTNVITARS